MLSTMRVVVLVALMMVAEVAWANCPIKATSGRSYNLNFGNIKGTEGTSFEYYFNFCENVPTNIYQGAPCSNAGNAYQIQLGTAPSCVLLGSITNVTELPNGGGLTVNMLNDVCCKCATNTVSRTVIMTILCGNGSVPTNLAVSEPANPKCQYTASFSHPNACPSAATGGVSTGSTTGGDHHGKGGLSGGSIFLIVFFVSAVVYLVAGFVVNWKVRGASPGVDAVPNIELWRQVPGLVVDGIVFTKNKVMGLFGRGYNQL